jgi:hypothetical protein
VELAEMKVLPRHKVAACAVAVLIATVASASAGAEGERPRRVLVVQVLEIFQYHMVS